MFRDTIDKLVGLLVPLGWATVAASQGVLSVAEPLAGAIVAGTALAVHLRASAHLRYSDAIERTLSSIERDLNEMFIGEHVSMEERELALDQLDRLSAFLSTFSPTYSDLVEQWRLDPQLIVNALVTKAREEDGVSGRWVELAIATAVKSITGDRDLFAELQPEVARVQLALLSSIQGTLTAVAQDARSIRAAQAQQATTLAELKSMVNALSLQQRLATDEAGIQPSVLIEMARRIRGDVNSADLALSELRNAVDTVVGLLARTQRANTVDSAVNDALRQLADLTRSGNFDEAAIAADHALSDWEIDRGASAEAGLRLVQAAVETAILRRDATSAAKHIEHGIRIEVSDPAKMFAALRAAQKVWFDRGEHRNAIELDVSIELGRLAVLRADNKYDFAGALNGLGVALLVRGERNLDGPGLEEAIATAREAATLAHRDVWPLDWARVQNNLGYALLASGRLQGSVVLMKEAIAAFEASLSVKGRSERAQRMTRMNLASVAAFLGEREKDPTQTVKAVQTYQAILRDWPAEDRSLDWASVQNNLGAALHQLGMQQNDTDALLLAIVAYRAALVARTREAAPMQWAQSRENLAASLLAVAMQTGNPKDLPEAKLCIEESILEYERLGIPAFDRQARALRDLIDARLGRAT